MNVTDYPFNLIRRIYGNRKSETHHIETTHLKNLYQQISNLTDEQQTIIQLRYKEKQTRKQCSETMNMTSAKSKQLEDETLRLLRSPIRTKHFQAVSKSELDEMTEKHDKLAEENVTLKAILRDVMNNKTSPEDLVTTRETIKTTRIQHDEMLSTVIELLDLSVRSYNGLKRAGFDTLRDITNVTEKYLLARRGIGEVVINEVKAMLETYNLSFSDTVNDEFLTDEQVGLFSNKWFDNNRPRRREV